MKLRKFVTVVAGVAAATVMALAPAAQAVAPTSITVGGSSANTQYGISGVAKLPLSVTIDTWLGDLTLGCDGGAPTGYVNGGTTGLSPNPAFEFTDLGLDCESPVGGQAVMTVTCNLDVVLTNTTSGTSTGTLYVTDPSTSQNCITVTAPGGCTFKIGGSTTATFSETVKTVGGVSYQDIVISGSGLEVKGPVSGCFSLVNAGDDITLTATFNVRVNGSTFQAIDVVP